MSATMNPKEETRTLLAGMAMQGYLAAFAGTDSKMPGFQEVVEESTRYAEALLAELERTAPKEEDWTGFLLDGTILRAGNNEEGIPTIEIEVTREALREIPFNLIGSKATTEVEDCRAKETQLAK